MAFGPITYGLKETSRGEVYVVLRVCLGRVCKALWPLQPIRVKVSTCQ